MKRALSFTAFAALMAVAILVSLVAACGGTPSTASLLSARLLSASDLPSGWSAAPVSPSGVQASAPCLPSLPKRVGWVYASTAFVEGQAIPSLGEVLATGPGARQWWQQLNSALARCRSATVTIVGHKSPVTIRPMAFPAVARESSAYVWTFTTSGIPVSATLVAFDTGKYMGSLSYSGIGSPSTAVVRAFADAAVAKAAAGTTSPVPGSVSITSSPVLTVSTDLGTVGYRVIGNGPPLVLVMGYAGTMSTWDPLLIEALAARHRVVIFDNAGIGPTSRLPGTLTIDAMADQTSALITALRLGRPDVLGWSMGTMIAEALAVRHPDQVRRLVLCAAYPGNGTAARPPQQAVNALSGPTGLAELFPADQAAAQNTYVAATSGYPATAPAPAQIVSAQAQAVLQWWAGRDPAGQRAQTITAPTLIADGTADKLDPLVNSHTLAGQVPGARLVLYPDAGHAFLFQDEAALVPVIDSFLGDS
jgi:pimeloyl-ACP methyl ester carboxylesterase